MKRQLMISLACLSLACPAAAATFDAPEPTMLTDALGFQCVNGGDYDDPFPAGKGVRAPQFCIQNPCDEVYTYDQFSNLIVGTAPDFWQWNRYKRVMNSQCGTNLPYYTDAQLYDFLDCDSCRIFGGGNSGIPVILNDEPIPASLPLPASVWLLLFALMLPVGIRRYVLV